MSEAPNSRFIYVTYIRTTPEKLWNALTDPATMREYWFGMYGESDFKAGSPWRLLSSEGRALGAGQDDGAAAPDAGFDQVAGDVVVQHGFDAGLDVVEALAADHRVRLFEEVSHEVGWLTGFIGR